MKKWWQSKTMWFNILSISIVVVQYGASIKVIPPELLTPIVAIINIMLRSITKTAIEKEDKYVN